MPKQCRQAQWLGGNLEKAYKSLRKDGKKVREEGWRAFLWRLPMAVAWFALSCTTGLLPARSLDNSSKKLFQVPTQVETLKKIYQKLENTKKSDANINKNILN